MNLASSLAHKCLVGVAVVGGAAGGVYASGGFSRWGDDGKERDKLGLPIECGRNGECKLDGGDLKRIKFEELEGEDGWVTISKGNVDVDLKILDLRNFSKKYIFTNGSGEDIVIGRGGKLVTLKANGETGFFNPSGDKKLREDAVGEYGIPERCGEKNSECFLLEDDLARIRFHGFPEEGKSRVTPLLKGDGGLNWRRRQFISLERRDGKYIFNNYFDNFPISEQWKRRKIEITRGGVSVTMDGNVESEFTAVDGGLKKEEYGPLGFPRRCEMGEDERSKSCSISWSEIKRVRFRAIGEGPDVVSIVDGMLLKIERTNEEGFPDGKKYTIGPEEDLLWIRSTTEDLESLENPSFIAIYKGKEKVFRNDNGYLVEVD